MSELANNRQAFHDYEILEKFEAGLSLLGYEVKSVKKGNLSLKGAFVTFHDNTPLLTNMHITAYKPAGEIPNYDPTRSRTLLLHKSQIKHLRGKAQEKGLTIVPISVYTKNHLIKVTVAVARGKKQFDKRAALRKRDLDREIRRMSKS